MVFPWGKSLPRDCELDKEAGRLGVGTDDTWIEGRERYGRPTRCPKLRRRLIRPSRRRGVLLGFAIAISLLSGACSLFAHGGTETLGEVKAGLICVEYRQDLPWQDVAAALAEPDEYPPPASGQDLSKNS